MPTTHSEMDPGDHPDLRRIANKIDAELTDVLAAEHHAARITAQRRMSLRDRLIRSEDLMAEVAVTTSAGAFTGTVVGVGTDHVVLDGDHERVVALHHIVMIEAV